MKELDIPSKEAKQRWNQIRLNGEPLTEDVEISEWMEADRWLEKFYFPLPTEEQELLHEFIQLVGIENVFSSYFNNKLISDICPILKEWNFLKLSKRQFLIVKTT